MSRVRTNRFGFVVGGMGAVERAGQPRRRTNAAARPGWDAFPPIESHDVPAPLAEQPLTFARMYRQGIVLILGVSGAAAGGWLLLFLLAGAVFL